MRGVCVNCGRPGEGYRCAHCIRGRVYLDARVPDDAMAVLMRPANLKVIGAQRVA